MILYDMLHFSSGLAFGLVLASCIIIISLIICLPKAPDVKTPSFLPYSATLEHRSHTNISVQFWVYLLPSRLQPYSPTHHTNDMTYSARITFIKNKLVLEYPDRNILDQEKTSTSFEFLEYVDTIDMSRARFSFLPSDLEDQEMFNNKFPILVEEQRHFVIFCASHREKEDLYRALVDSSTYLKMDLATKNIGMKVGDENDKNVSFKTFMECNKNWKEINERCTCDSQAIENESLELFNNITELVFNLVKDEEIFKTFLRTKILKKLGKVKFLKSHFPDYYLESVDSGQVPLLIERVGMPYMDKHEGIFLPFKVEYEGIATAQIFLDRERDESEVKRMSFIMKLRNSILKHIGFRLEVLSLRGNLCLHCLHMGADRMWFGFTSEPHLELQMFLLINGKAWQNMLVNKLLQLAIRKLQRRFVESFVLPNMHEFPVKCPNGK